MGSIAQVEEMESPPPTRKVPWSKTAAHQDPPRRSPTSRSLLLQHIQDDNDAAVENWHVSMTYIGNDDHDITKITAR